MRISSRALIILVVLSGHAFAKGKKAPAAKPGAGMMDSNDPVEKEKSDKGPFAPTSDSDDAKDKAAEEAPAPKEMGKRRPRDKAVVFGNVLIGFSKGAPEPGPGSVASGSKASVTLMVGGRYDFSPAFSLGLRVPWTTASARQNDGTVASAQALGAPELMGEYRVTLSPLTRLPILFGVGIPLAQGNYDSVDDQAHYRQTQVNEVADATSGYRDGELFGPKRVPVIAGVGIDYERNELGLHAATKFVLGVNAGGNLNHFVDPAGSYELKSVTFRDVTSAGIAYQFLSKPALYGALDSWIAYNAINAVEFTSANNATPPTRFQVVFQPKIGARFGKIAPSVGYVFPIGGRLADTSSSGLELHCDVLF